MVTRSHHVFWQKNKMDHRSSFDSSFEVPASPLIAQERILNDDEAIDVEYIMAPFVTPTRL